MRGCNVGVRCSVRDREIGFGHAVQSEDDVLPLNRGQRLGAEDWVEDRGQRTGQRATCSRVVPQGGAAGWCRRVMPQGDAAG